MYHQITFEKDPGNLKQPDPLTLIPIPSMESLQIKQLVDIFSQIFLRKHAKQGQRVKKDKKFTNLQENKIHHD